MFLTTTFSDRSVAVGYLAGFVLCIALLAGAYYFEYVMFLDPCPLCIIQRIATLGIGIGCLLAFLLRFTVWPHRIALLLTTVSAGFGTWIADHHVWLQHLPKDQVPACGPSLDYLVETLPFNELVTTVLRGSGSCADVSWLFLGLSMPEWTRIIFVAFTVVAVAGLIRACLTNMHKKP